jgi:hypothetical protein
MNERIRSLAEQAKAYANQCTKDIDGDVSWHWMDYYTEKFAELIVRKCVAQIRPMWNQVKEVGVPPGYDYDTFDLAYNDCMNAIKQHFGVEE